MRLLPLAISIIGVPGILVTNPGVVYLVLGSDTAIWEGMNVNQYRCYFNIDLYTNPLRNAYKVMDPAFRSWFVDSYGQPLKMTWWMMAGSIFREGRNNNVPLPNIMTLYLMKKYHGDNVHLNGDELSLHYHTFKWTDYDGDGIYWWNQARSFEECREDFDLTLAQMLLEEEVFPVSFRSGWHYMDNVWQNYLNELLPYSMHNDYPNIATDSSEPIDNIYDWSQAPSAFVPYHPSPENYQVPGETSGWNVRSTHMYTLRYRNLMDTLFAQASQGVDQVACIWGHLPEADFLENIVIVDSLAHAMAQKYSGVMFRYCTAEEAMQRWRRVDDEMGPQLTISESTVGMNVYYEIESDEPIFQAHPFVAVKDIYERYRIIPCEPAGVYRWRTTTSVSADQLAKLGIAATDTSGNLTTHFIRYKPEDVYVDNGDAGYREEKGNWTTSSSASWGLDSRRAVVEPGDTASVSWEPDLQEAGYYNIFVQVPSISGGPDATQFTIGHAYGIDTVQFKSPLRGMDWVYVSTAYHSTDGDFYLRMRVTGDSQAAVTAVADVAKFSALVRDRDMRIEKTFVNLGEVSEGDTVTIFLKVLNRGFQTLTLTEVSSVYKTVSSGTTLPLEVPGMGAIDLPLHFWWPHLGLVTDTILVKSNDPANPEYRIPLTADVQAYFKVVDNEDSVNYHEKGTWYYSNAQAYGPTSRYAYLSSTGGASATFTTSLERAGLYTISEIVPTTKNASNRAAYVISTSTEIHDTVFIDQNRGSGYWVLLGQYHLPAKQPIQVKVADAGQSTSGAVLRADAVKIQLSKAVSVTDVYPYGQLPAEFKLGQNYPNPFNSLTTIPYELPISTNVSLVVYDVLGRRIKILVSEYQEAGRGSVWWDGTDEDGEAVGTGVYIYRLEAGPFAGSRKVTILR